METGASTFGTACPKMYPNYKLWEHTVWNCWLEYYTIILLWIFNMWYKARLPPSITWDFECNVRRVELVKGLLWIPWQGQNRNSTKLRYKTCNPFNDPAEYWLFCQDNLLRVWLVFLSTLNRHMGTNTWLW